jgi:aldehyde dehydrogenase (NAD+)
MNTTTSPSLPTTAQTRLLIDGEFADSLSGETFKSINPASGAAFVEVALGRADDVDRAVAAARRALGGAWGKTGPLERQRILLRLADLVEQNAEELALLDTLDMGAPFSKAKLYSTAAVGSLLWFSSAARQIRGATIESTRGLSAFSSTLKEPVGVVGAITPWNGPLATTVWKLGAVLATGCTAVLKPAEQSPLSGIRFAELCLEAGAPPGVINVVTGEGEAGAALSAHPDVDKISFTGSVETGKAIVRASAGNLKRLTMELGGKSPNIIFADADLDKAAESAAMAVFEGSGQVCVAGSRLFIERPVYDDVVARVAEVGKSLVVGDPFGPATQLGPLVSQEQLDRVLGYVKTGIEEGATVREGGSRVTEDGLESGYFVRPTVFSEVVDGMTIAREEIFGPVISAMPFDTDDEVVERANATEFGLAAAVWTSDVTRAHQLGRRIQAGNVWVNGYRLIDPTVPFGGYKQSGYGKELGLEQLDEFLNTKAFWVAL